MRLQSESDLMTDLDLPSEQYLSARLEMDRPPDAEGSADSAAAWLRTHFRPTVEQLEERLRGVPQDAEEAPCEVAVSTSDVREKLPAPLRSAPPPGPGSSP